MKEKSENPGGGEFSTIGDMVKKIKDKLSGGGAAKERAAEQPNEKIFKPLTPKETRSLKEHLENFSSEYDAKRIEEAEKELGAFKAEYEKLKDSEDPEDREIYRSKTAVLQEEVDFLTKHFGSKLEK